VQWKLPWQLGRFFHGVTNTMAIAKEIVSQCRIGALCDRGALFAGVASLVAGLMVAPLPAQAQSEENLAPSACQTYFFVNRAVYETAGLITPAPFDLPAKVGGHAADIGLRTCPAVLAAPKALIGSDSFEVDDVTASSLDPEIENPASNDPACYASVPQSITRAPYKVTPYSRVIPKNWGALGDPQIVHLDTGVDVRLYTGSQPDDPATPGYESLLDAWRLHRNDNGETFVRVPIGKNRLVYRADTLMAPIDAFFVYIPNVPKSSRLYKTIVTNSTLLADALIDDFRLTAGRDFIATENDLVEIVDALTTDFRHGQLGLFDDIYEDAYQDVWVLDTVPPVITTDTDTSAMPENSQAVLSYDEARGVFYMEAIHPGGILAGRGVQLMEPLLDYNDHCDRLVRLEHNSGGAELWATGDVISLEWTASDPGPANADGDVNTVSLVHTIEIRDSFAPVLLAPPSIVVELPAGQEDQTVPLDLGVPRVFDLADLTPDVANNWTNVDGTNNEFGLGLTEVTWSASDGANTSTAVQLVIIKEEGTNTPPVADAQQVDVLSYAETEITLTGSDRDYHESVDRFDPLTFRIVEPPQNGDLVAPLLPYFIEDVRLEASALQFDGDVMQQDPVEYCRNAQVTDVLAYQQAYPRWPEWMAVDDTGNTIVFDHGSIQCDNGTANFNSRLAIFDERQALVEWQDVLDGGSPSDIFWDQRTNRIYVASQHRAAFDRVEIFAADLTPIARYDLEAGSPDRELELPISVSVDSRGILYVASEQKVNAYRPLNRISNVPGVAIELDGDVEWLATAWNRPAGHPAIESIAIDHLDNLYLSFADRIVKVAAAKYVEPGPTFPGQPTVAPSFTPGAQIGWLGGCEANLTNLYACDTHGRRSLGYSCTDVLCGQTISGDGAGQLSGARGIAIDPNGVLYVADSSNRRVQRFTPDGGYGGEARSTGAGYGFLLGDFGFPTDIEVNSDHFYLLNRDANLLHSFQTTPITPISDNSASVTYRSTNNYVGDDEFRFATTDGFDIDEATVSISVTRNFRPPEIPASSLITTAPPVLEDSQRTFSLAGTDPDGALDALSVVITVPPQHGRLQVDGLQVTYTPDPDFFGEDEFSYQVFDGIDTSEQTAIVSLNVAPDPDPPSVRVVTENDASLGYLLGHFFEVTDPDSGELFTFSIDWGDGETTSEGHFELDGIPIPPDDVIGATGDLRDGVALTGPVLGTAANGMARSGATHIYAMSGTYTVTTCVYDQVRLNPETQEKSLTAESQEVCSADDVNIMLRSEILIDVQSPEGESAKGSDVEFTARVRNLPFDLAADDPRYSMLPSSGLDALDLRVSGELPPGLELLVVTSNDAMCTSSRSQFECVVANLPYASDLLLNLTVRIGTTVPGRAQLGFAAQAEWSGGREASVGSGDVRIQSTGEAPELDALLPASARADDYAVILLRGHGFEFGTQVFFGAMPGTQVSVIDSTMLTVRVPHAPPGVVDVSVVNPDDQTFTIVGAWTYIDAAVAPPLSPPRRGGGGVEPVTLFGLLVLVALSRVRRRFVDRIRALDQAVKSGSH